MRAVVQRVSSASVLVEGKVVGEIAKGFLVFLGVKQGDTEKEAEYIAKKIAKMRIFADADDKMNLDLSAVGGSVLAVSQFTLLADTRKGNRPSFIEAARGEKANDLYQCFCENVRAYGLVVKEGVFGADMKVELINDGPVTIVLEI